MHGDEFIGPHTLLYAYKHLKADKIIYFPVANPSGFAQGKRETFPGNIDVNRDFPIDGNKQCYCTTATHILDMLFRKYRFDLTVALHNGGSGAEISYNWGTITHASNSHTD
jgi:predicted deacylase